MKTLDQLWVVNETIRCAHLASFIAIKAFKKGFDAATRKELGVVRTNANKTIRILQELVQAIETKHPSLKD